MLAVICKSVLYMAAFLLVSLPHQRVSPLSSSLAWARHAQAHRACFCMPALQQLSKQQQQQAGSHDMLIMLLLPAHMPALLRSPLTYGIRC
jgi:hypothetical protein